MEDVMNIKLKNVTFSLILEEDNIFLVIIYKNTNKESSCIIYRNTNKKCSVDYDICKSLELNNFNFNFIKNQGHN